jgi:hypothetical protein
MASPHRLRKSAARQAAREAVRSREAIAAAVLEHESSTSMAAALRAAVVRP